MITITKDNFEKEVLQAEGTVLVDFWAAWCMPCKMLSPILDEVSAERPDIKIDGEFQLDSAIIPEVAAKKVKRESEVAGCANVLIFPDLNAGNIGVKLIQRFAGADAYGPLLQGFKKICSDCSRGAPVSELVGNIAISVVRAGELENGK